MSSVFTLWIRDDATGAERTMDLPTFQPGRETGMTIGSSPDVDVVLPGPSVAPKHVRAVALSNHKTITVLAPGVSVLEQKIKPGTERRVDNREFEVGSFTLRFGERELS